MNHTPRIAAAALAVMVLALAGWGQMLSQPQEAALVTSAWSGGEPEVAAPAPEATLEERIAAAFAAPEQTPALPTGKAASLAAGGGIATGELPTADQPVAATRSPAPASRTAARAAGRGDARIEARASGASVAAGDVKAARLKERAERRLAAVARRIDAAARGAGEVRVSERLAAELGTSVKALRAARARDAWSQIVIAHTLRSSAHPRVPAGRLLERRRQGAPWSEIIGELRLDLDGAVRAISAEARVVSGQARADGRVAAIHGAGSRSGVEPLGAAGPAAGAGLAVSAGAAVPGLGDLPRLRTGP